MAFEREGILVGVAGVGNVERRGDEISVRSSGTGGTVDDEEGNCNESRFVWLSDEDGAPITNGLGGITEGENTVVGVNVPSAFGVRVANKFAVVGEYSAGLCTSDGDKV